MTEKPENKTMTPQIQRLEKRIECTVENTKALDLLAGSVPLSRQKLKQTMEKGGVWLKKAKGGRRRLRRAKTLLQSGDVLELHYDAFILASVAPVPRLISDRLAYSVWYKPENMLSQGSMFADHCAITRWVEKNHVPHRTVYLVHRLDRAAQGLMLLAHDQKMAAKLSKLFAAREIQKRYRVMISGRFDAPLPLHLDSPLDGKAAESVILSAHAEAEKSELIVEIKTGRKHQIRRHLSDAGWPVLGDKLYGDKDSTGSLELIACLLNFICPIKGGPVTFQLDR
jgi:tRNA pseudouridine32 synthase/23S rRNA pseudouridine746 synthase